MSRSMKKCSSMSWSSCNVFPGKGMRKTFKKVTDPYLGLPFTLWVMSYADPEAGLFFRITSGDARFTQESGVKWCFFSLLMNPLMNPRMITVSGDESFRWLSCCMRRRQSSVMRRDQYLFVTCLKEWKAVQQQVLRKSLVCTTHWTTTTKQHTIKSRWRQWWVEVLKWV